MAYQYNGPSLAHGGRLVKKASVRPKPTYRPEPKEVLETGMACKQFTVGQWLDMMGLDNRETRGLGGGGQMPIRNLVQKTRPSKSRHFCTRRAHPSLLRTTK